jgi:hypothetical protein
MERDAYVPDLIAASDCMLGTFSFRYKNVDNEILELLLCVVEVIAHLSVLSGVNSVM